MARKRSQGKGSWPEDERNTDLSIVQAMLACPDGKLPLIHVWLLYTIRVSPNSHIETDISVTSYLGC